MRLNPAKEDRRLVSLDECLQWWYCVFHIDETYRRQKISAEDGKLLKAFVSYYRARNIGLNFATGLYSKMNL